MSDAASELEKTTAAEVGEIYDDIVELEQSAASFVAASNDLRSLAQDLGFEGPSVVDAQESFSDLSSRIYGSAEMIEQLSTAANLGRSALEEAAQDFTTLPPAGLRGDQSQIIRYYAESGRPVVISGRNYSESEAREYYRSLNTRTRQLNARSALERLERKFEDATEMSMTAAERVENPTYDARNDHSSREPFGPGGGAYPGGAIGGSGTTFPNYSAASGAGSTYQGVAGSGSSAGHPLNTPRISTTPSYTSVYEPGPASINYSGARGPDLPVSNFAPSTETRDIPNEATSFGKLPASETTVQKFGGTNYRPEDTVAWADGSVAGTLPSRGDVVSGANYSAPTGGTTGATYGGKPGTFSNPGGHVIGAGTYSPPAGAAAIAGAGASGVVAGGTALGAAAMRRFGPESTGASGASYNAGGASSSGSGGSAAILGAAKPGSGGVNPGSGAPSNSGNSTGSAGAPRPNSALSGTVSGAGGNTNSVPGATVGGAPGTAPRSTAMMGAMPMGGGVGGGSSGKPGGPSRGGYYAPKYEADELTPPPDLGPGGKAGSRNDY